MLCRLAYPRDLEPLLTNKCHLPPPSLDGFPVSPSHLLPSSSNCPLSPARTRLPVPRWWVQVHSPWRDLVAIIPLQKDNVANHSPICQPLFTEPLVCYRHNNDQNHIIEKKWSLTSRGLHKDVCPSYLKHNVLSSIMVMTK